MGDIVREYERIILVCKKRVYKYSRHLEMGLWNIRYDSFGCKFLSSGKKRLIGSLKSPGTGLSQAFWESQLHHPAVLLSHLSSSCWGGFHCSLHIVAKWRHSSNCFVLSNPAWGERGSLSQKYLLCLFHWLRFGHSLTFGPVTASRKRWWCTDWGLGHLIGLVVWGRAGDTPSHREQGDGVGVRGERKSPDQLQEGGCMDTEWPKHKCPLLLAPGRKCNGLVWHKRPGLELRGSNT